MLVKNIFTVCMFVLPDTISTRSGSANLKRTHAHKLAVTEANYAAATPAFCVDSLDFADRLGFFSERFFFSDG